MNKQYSRKVKIAVIVAGAALIPTAAVFISSYIVGAVGDSATASMNVTANVKANCKFSSTANDLNFGTYDPIYANLTANLDASSAFDIKCTKGTSVILRLGLGNYAVGNQRRMYLNTENYLNYDLYSDAARTVVWNPTVYVSFTTSSSAPVTETVYGRVPGGQDISTGNYSDIVQITAEF